jgi:hypothetical protein
MQQVGALAQVPIAAGRQNGRPAQPWHSDPDVQQVRQLVYDKMYVPGPVYCNNMIMALMNDCRHCFAVTSCFSNVSLACRTNGVISYRTFFVA